MNAIHYAYIAGLGLLGAALAFAGWSVGGRLVLARRQRAGSRDSVIDAENGAGNAEARTSGPAATDPPTMADLAARLDAQGESLGVVAGAQAQLIGEMGKLLELVGSSLSGRLDAIDAQSARLPEDVSARIAALLDDVPRTVAQALAGAQDDIATAVVAQLPPAADSAAPIVAKVDGLAAALIRQHSGLETRLDSVDGALAATAAAQSGLAAQLAAQDGAESAERLERVQTAIARIAEDQSMVAARIDALGAEKHVDPDTSERLSAIEAALTALAAGRDQTAAAQDGSDALLTRLAGVEAAIRACSDGQAALAARIAAAGAQATHAPADALAAALDAIRSELATLSAERGQQTEAAVTAPAPEPELSHAEEELLSSVGLDGFHDTSDEHAALTPPADRDTMGDLSTLPEPIDVDLAAGVQASASPGTANQPDDNDAQDQALDTALDTKEECGTAADDLHPAGSLGATDGEDGDNHADTETADPAEEMAPLDPALLFAHPGLSVMLPVPSATRRNAG